MPKEVQYTFRGAKILYAEPLTAIILQIPEVVSRSEFMRLLMDARMMLIRATYNDRQRSSSIKDISIESADENGRAGAKASKVEKCDCQQGYSGMYENLKCLTMFSNSFLAYWDMT